MIKEAIQKVVGKGDLTFDEAYTVMKEIMSGESTPTQNAAYLAALSTKNARAETTEEISGSAAAMREMAETFEVPFDTLEIVGTGGDNASSFNISTTSMFVIAAGGVKVSKHGNRAASSKSGTADCLESLGVNIDQDPETCTRLLRDINMCFMFAQRYHKSMGIVGSIRKELGFRTVFNILGPLTNPLRPEYMVLGVYDGYLVEPLARVINDLGVKHGMVVYGKDKLDEISVSAPTEVCEVKNGEYRSYEIYPEVFGLPRANKSDLAGGTPDENAQITRDILSGKIQGAKRNTVLLNSAAGLYVAGAASSLANGLELARELVDSGAAYEQIEKFVTESNVRK
ncbi:anthranilate phosphoribosyltransferase [Actinobaculum suis]|uniref:Anthranilate phosphoribosyltransferase n=1 Tax=Actinobaculum suis TaxID=1657 RepID=A0A7Z9C857_9ACTO|nr:anthranilate phosphoribosyltransferase [Actinobaculum suis]VDG76068.1 anthranilate phosphoribosyltransferase [Actinobaculum suis]